MAPLLSITSLSMSYGTRALFSDISLVIGENDRTALIGPNGAGKSTLFKIIARVQEPDSGHTSAKKGLIVGYVPQVEDLPENSTVEQVLTDVFDKSFSDTTARVSICIGTCGFPDRNKRVSELSGGWRKRLSIAKALIKEPDLLLLDEPTNHLDIESILWLEELLLESNQAAVFISHDRYFLEKISTRVVELDKIYEKGFLSSDGTYTDFLERRMNFVEQMASYRDSLENKVRREVAWLRRGAKARTTKARGRIKRAEGLITELKTMPTERGKAELEFADGARRTRELVKAERISQSLGGRQLFKHLNLTLSPGTRLGIVGSNGSGKTTLIKTILGRLAPEHGSVRLAHNLRIAYFDQKRDQLDLTRTLRKTLCPEGDSVVFNDAELHVVSWAKRFLFTNDHLSLPVGSLSGGERARVLLAQLMLQPADLLVLDEPTNDLDIPTLEVLEETLCEFKGAVLLVTHDRSLLAQVCTSVVGLLGDGSARTYADYAQWEDDWEDHKAAKSKASKSEVKERPSLEKEHSQNTPKKLTYAERLELESIEKTIVEAEKKVTDIQDEMSSPEKAKDSDWLTKKCEELANAEHGVEKLYARWQELEQRKTEGA